MTLQFVIKEPDKAYVGNRLWLPKAAVRESQVKRALEFLVAGKDGQELLRLWNDAAYHVVCPREFLPSSQYSHYKFPFVDLSPQFERIEFEDCVVPRDEEQQKAWAAFSVNHNGILNLGCGKGKTKLAVKKIAQMKVPTLVIVPDGGILTQWQEAILGSDRTPVGLKFHGSLGLIQGPQFEWKEPIVIALISTLALKIRDGKIPEEFFRRFGLIIYDEVHRLGAPVFSLCAEPFYGDRIGLTATVQREDGLDPIYRYHLGEPFYTDLSQDLVPRIYFWRTPAKPDFQVCKMKGGTINISMLRTLLGRDHVGNAYRYYAIQEALSQGRKILCLSHSKDQLKLFHAIFPQSGLILGATPKEDRTSILRSNQVVFAIAKLGSEGVDDSALDTLFWLTPFRSKISLQQSMGRIQRLFAGKQTPVMVVFEDHLAGPLRSLCHKLRANLRAWGFALETHPPYPYPLTLPPELMNVYAAAFSELPARPNLSDD